MLYLEDDNYEIQFPIRNFLYKSMPLETQLFKILIENFRILHQKCSKKKGGSVFEALTIKSNPDYQ